MEIDTVILIGIGKFLAGLRTIVGAIIETVAMPCGAGELGPFDMVGQQFARSGVEHIDLGPVTA